VLIIAEAPLLLISWGVSQFPYIIPLDVTAANATSPQQAQVLLLVVLLLSVFVLANYSANEPVKTAPTEVKVLTQPRVKIMWSHRDSAILV
jgi:hypothetical protein